MATLSYRTTEKSLVNGFNFINDIEENFIKSKYTLYFSRMRKNVRNEN